MKISFIYSRNIRNSSAKYWDSGLDRCLKIAFYIIVIYPIFPDLNFMGDSHSSHYWSSKVFLEVVICFFGRIPIFIIEWYITAPNVYTMRLDNITFHVFLLNYFLVVSWPILYNTRQQKWKYSHVLLISSDYCHFRHYISWRFLVLEFWKPVSKFFGVEV